MQRYIPQLLVPEIGSEGQKKISAARVLIIGAGGLGTPLAIYLAAAGVGTIGIVDGDQVGLSNLSRQFMYNPNDVGQSKAGSLSAKLKLQNPDIKVTVYPEMVTDNNIADYIASYDIICDCTDNAQARILIDHTCSNMHKPLVYAVVRGWEGYVAVFHHQQKRSLEDVFTYQDMIDHDALNCSVAGIVNAACGIAGSIQASEAIKIIVGIDSELDGGILMFNAMGPVFKVFKLNKPRQVEGS